MLHLAGPMIIIIYTDTFIASNNYLNEFESHVINIIMFKKS